MSQRKWETVRDVVDADAGELNFEYLLTIWSTTTRAAARHDTAQHGSAPHCGAV